MSMAQVVCRRRRAAPLGRLTLAAASAARTSSRPRPMAVQGVGVDLHAHRRQGAAADEHLADARRPARASAAGCVEADVVHLRPAYDVGGEGEDQDRARRRG